jgi:enolase-phosphatase E1
VSAPAILTDIEGTTTDVAFVHQVLFPIARARIPGFVHAHPDDPSVAAVRRTIATRGGSDEGSVTLDEVIATLVGWIDVDRKDTALKAIQGAIWKDAYAGGALQAHVYDDVEPALRLWQAAGVPIYVFSSGSVEAQVLLFRHTSAGDLTRYFAGYFDTTTGPKREAASYATIAEAMGRAPEVVVFLSDVVAELDAARAAGMQTALVVRPGTRAEPPGGAHLRVESFADVRVPYAAGSPKSEGNNGDLTVDRYTNAVITDRHE